MFDLGQQLPHPCTELVRLRGLLAEEIHLDGQERQALAQVVVQLARDPPGLVLLGLEQPAGLGLLELLEEPGVLDGDHGLVGEGLKQRDLLVGERIHLGTPELDRAHRRPLPQQWNAQRRPVAQLSCEGTAFGKLLPLAREIRHVHGPLLEHRASRDGSPRHRDQEPDGGVKRALVGSDSQAFPVELKNSRVVRAAQLRRALDDGLQHWLELRRRRTDDSQDVARPLLLLQGLRELAVARLQSRE